jgi:hypothetical protein
MPICWSLLEKTNLFFEYILSSKTRPTQIDLFFFSSCFVELFYKWKVIIVQTTFILSFISNKHYIIMHTNTIVRFAMAMCLVFLLFTTVLSASSVSLKIFPFTYFKSYAYIICIIVIRFENRVRIIDWHFCFFMLACL